MTPNILIQVSSIFLRCSFDLTLSCDVVVLKPHKQNGDRKAAKGAVVDGWQRTRTMEG